MRDQLECELKLRADSQVDAAREQAVNAEREIEKLRAEFSDKQADIETRVEDRVKMLLEEYKTAARNAETKLATREREWEQHAPASARTSRRVWCPRGLGRQPTLGE